MRCSSEEWRRPAQGRVMVSAYFISAAVPSMFSLRRMLPAASPDRIATLVLRSAQTLDLDKLSTFMEDLLERHGNALLRYKGVLHVAGEPRRMVFQGVLRLYGFDWDTEWGMDEPRESVLVFIGDNLPEEEIRAGFAAAPPLAINLIAGI